MYILLAPTGRGTHLRELTDDGAAAHGPEVLSDVDLAARVREREALGGVRWVWAHTSETYARLLGAGVRVERAWDLGLSRAILGGDTDPRWQRRDQSPIADAGATLFDAPEPEPLLDPEAVRAEFVRQRAMLGRRAERDAAAAGALSLLLAAESGGALIAAEIHHDGLPWNAAEHERLLVAELGPKPTGGRRPARAEAQANVVRRLLSAPDLNPDSSQDLLRALRAAGLSVQSTGKWELRGIDHPVVPALTAYRSLMHLYSGFGWSWLETWVSGGRYRPDYLVGGTATGRWSAQGGGAMQIPPFVRQAVLADPGWTFVVADAAQVEPRILAGMSRDEAMAAAGRGHDLYSGLVDAGIASDRPQAKVAMLGALYGATSGDSGALMPRLKRAFPKAIARVQEAADRGVRGEAVQTWLGRSSGVANDAWLDEQRLAATLPGGHPRQRDAQRIAAERGRFTRNFIVQGTAAEWALCWLASTRQGLHALDQDDVAPQIVFFLHDEVVIHTPIRQAEAVAEVLRESARRAGTLLFGTFPVEFPITVATVRRYSDAK